MTRAWEPAAPAVTGAAAVGPSIGAVAIAREGRHPRRRAVYIAGGSSSRAVPGVGRPETAPLKSPW